MQLAKPPHDRTDMDSELESSSKKLREDQKADEEVFYSSFFTTACIYHSKGVAIVNRCCFDSGFEATGAAGYISPSLVEESKLETYPYESETITASGDTHTTFRRTKVSLTFKTDTGHITLEDLELDVDSHDSDHHHILLSMGALNMLGGVHDHRSNPSRFLVTDPESGELCTLLPSWYRDNTNSFLIWKSDTTMYIEHLIQQPGFHHYEESKRSLPETAYQGAATSQQLREFVLSPDIWSNLLEDFDVPKDVVKKFAANLEDAFVVWIARCEVEERHDTLIQFGVDGEELQEAYRVLCSEFVQRGATERLYNLAKMLPKLETR